jgi:hypothetical protein
MNSVDTIRTSETPHQVEEGWLQLPEERRLGLATKVTLDRGGRSLWMFDRCGAADCVGSMLDPIFEFDRLGNLLVRFGAEMFNHPDGLHIDQGVLVFLIRSRPFPA